MTDKRKLEILDKLLSWIGEHTNEFIACAIEAAGLTDEEVQELDLCYDDGEVKYPAFKGVPHSALRWLGD